MENQNEINEKKITFFKFTFRLETKMHTVNAKWFDGRKNLRKNVVEDFL